jgi:hypothetical protein
MTRYAGLLPPIDQRALALRKQSWQQLGNPT